MTFTEYQWAALRTASMGLGRDVEMCVRALGLVGETVELCEAMGTGDEAETKEAGDVLWYTATLADAFGLDGTALGIYALNVPMSTADRGVAACDLIIAAGKLAELVKKQVGHKKPAAADKVADLLTTVISSLATLSPVSLDHVAQVNVAKLAARYPAGFDFGIASKKADSDEPAGWKPGPV